MRGWPGLRRVFRLPTTTARVRADVDAELAFHIQGRVDELVASGMARIEAEREARARFGDYRAIEHEVERLERRRHRRRTLRERIEEIMNDLRYAVRSLMRQPLFSLVVVMTLTLGIGATAAIFHAVDRAVLRPVPYPDADRIVFLAMKRLRGNMGNSSLTAGRYQFWHANSRLFEHLATSRGFEAEADQAKGGIVVQGLRVTSEFLAVVGVTPERGRPFVADDYSAAATPVALLSDAAWRNRFGGSASILGSTIQLNDSRVTVVGILPPTFEVVGGASKQPDIFMPLILTPRDLTDGGMNYSVIGKLRRGLSPQQIADDNTSVFAQFHAMYPGYVDGNDAGVDLRSFQEVFVGGLADALWILLAATGFVFILACANVANVVLARTLGRQREFAIRGALGSGRGRIARQIILEMLVLGGVAASVSVVVSLGAVRAIVGLTDGGMMRAAQLQLDWRVVALTVLAAGGATVIIGAGAALFATRASSTGQLAASTRRDGLGGGRTLRSVLVTIESALAMVLLAGAGLLIASFNRVLDVDGGFRREGIYTASVAHTPRNYKMPEVNAFERRVLERLRATPGIQVAASTATLPLRRGWNIPTTVLGHNDRTEGPTEWRAVSPDYFRAMDVPIVAGRGFSTADVAGAPRVVLVSQSYAETFFPGENPIGQRVMIGVYKGDGPDSTASQIVGVVPDLKDASLEYKRFRHTVWVPSAQGGLAGPRVPAFVVRSSDATVASNALRAAITEADARMGVPDVQSMNDIVTQSLAPRRFTMVLMTTFAAVALLLTCIGIYGVTSYAVSQRTQEIGVRIALGARPTNVVALIVGQGARPAIIGLVIGLGLAAWASKAIASMLFGIGPRDPASLGIVAGLLALVALVASYLPARRAARVDPVTALRSD